MDLTTGLKPFQDRVTSSLLDVTRIAGEISAEDLSFHRSSNTAFSRSLDAQNARLLQLTQKLLQAATRTGSSVSPPKLRDREDLDDKWPRLVDVVDDLLEHADACLDEYTGVIKRTQPTTHGGEASSTKEGIKFRQTSSIFSARQIAKPQLLFHRSPNNHETKPFKPLLRTKPHAVVDLQESIGNGEGDGFG